MKKKLTLSFLNQDELSKQKQRFITGGLKEECICVGLMCECFSSTSNEVDMGERDGMALAKAINRDILSTVGPD